MAKLFESLDIQSVRLKNRLVVSPMCQYSANDGMANDWHLVHLGSRAVGGAGLVFSEACSVSPEGRISTHDIGLWNDDQIAPLKRIVDFINQNGSIPGIQLAHAGRKAGTHAPSKGGHFLTKEEGGWTRVGPSDIPFKPDSPVPKSLSIKEIRSIQDNFAHSAQRALRAGFKVVEIHAAHGYLINQFLSPLSNHRQDEYGGSFDNRIRFLLEIINKVKNVWPESLPLFVRISATEWVDGGWDIHDSVRLSRILKDLGVDLIDCSSGGNVYNVKIPLSPGYQVGFSQAIKKEAGISTGAVGLITDPGEANKILEDDAADLIFIGREFLRNPYFPLQAANDLKVDQDWPFQYQRAKS